MDKPQLVSMWVAETDRDWLKIVAATEKRPMHEVITSMRKLYEER